MVSLLNSLLLGEHLTILQWLSIWIQIFGIIPVIASTNSSSASNSDTSANTHWEYPVDVIVLMLFTCLMASINTVYNASAVKKLQVPIALQNAILYAFGVIINTMFYFGYQSGHGHDDEHNKKNASFFQGYGHTGVWVLLVLNSFVGISITMIYKYGDAVLKTLTSPMSASVLVFISWLFFDMELNVVKAAGAGVVLVDTLLYLHLPSPTADTTANNNDSTKRKTHNGVSFLVLVCAMVGLQFIGSSSSPGAGAAGTRSSSNGGLKAFLPSITSTATIPKQKRRPQYALELSGGLRTFLGTWPMLYEHLILPNGGRDNFVISIAATYDDVYLKHPAALDMVGDLTADFDFVQLYSSDNETRVCLFYDQPPDCKLDTKLAYFPHQWESVTKAHDAIIHSNDTPTTSMEGIELYVRIRPDDILMSNIDLKMVKETLVQEGKELWIPCVEDRFAMPNRAIDDFVIGTRNGMDRYAARYSPFDTGLVAEMYVFDQFWNISHRSILADYGILRLQRFVNYTKTGLPFYSWLDSRCRAEPERKLVPLLPNLTAYNATHIDETIRMSLFLN